MNSINIVINISFHFEYFVGSQRKINFNIIPYNKGNTRKLELMNLLRNYSCKIFIYKPF